MEGRKNPMVAETLPGAILREKLRWMKDVLLWTVNLREIGESELTMYHQ